MAGTREYEDLNKNLEMVDGHAVKAPEDYQDPEELYQALIARVRKYHPSADITMIEKAYQIGKEAHKDQFRKSGEPYIIHPLWVAIILADLEMDKETIVAGMLHDTVEDTEMTVEDITREFGEEVALLVDGVTKLGQLSFKKASLLVELCKSSFIRQGRGQVESFITTIFYLFVYLRISKKKAQKLLLYYLMRGSGKPALE